MAFELLTQPEFQQNFLQAYQAGLNVTANLQPGSIGLALADANAKVAMILQYIANQTVAFSRSITSTGVDVDSWLAQFGFTRKSATNAQGTVVFSAPQVVQQPLYIPVNAVISTSDGSNIQYKVIPDVTNANYNSATQQYILPSGQQSVSVSVEAVVAGSSQSVQINQLNQIVTPIAGFSINGVTNPAAIATTSNAETDAAVIARFIVWINSLSKGTEDAILAALQGFASVLKVSLFENVQLIGNPPTGIIQNNASRGNFVALIDDGSGNPPQTLLDACYNTLFGDVRGFTISYQIYRPAIVAPQIIIPVYLPSTAQPGVELPIIQASVMNYLNTMPIGAPNTNGIIYQNNVGTVAKNASAVEIAVKEGYPTFNGVGSDFALQSWQEILVTASNVSVVLAT